MTSKPKIVKKNDKKNGDVISELEEKIKGMKKDQESKCSQAKEQLINQLEVTADKYRTATGVMEALRVIRMVQDDTTYDIESACVIALNMANEVMRMKDVAENLEYEKMDNLCDDFYVKDYASIEEYGVIPLAFELMRLDLCRNVGPAAEDITEFYKRSTQDIDDTKEELSKQVVERFGK